MKLNNVVSFLGTIFQTPQVKTITPVNNQYSQNPFAGPFIASQNQTQDSYGKNKPVQGGFFAGYYNGKPNIVGTRLFIEV